MVRQARVLAQATSDLVNAMRSDAEAEVDVDNSKKLLAAAKLLAPTRTQLPLNVYSRRIGLLIQVSRTLWKMKVTDSVSPGFRVAL